MTSEHISETVFCELFNCSPPFNGFEPAQMKPALNLSQVDEWPEDISELDKCFYEPASIIVIPTIYIYVIRENGFS